MPRAPIGVDTTGSPAAMKSNILMLVPDPENIGFTATSAAARYSRRPASSSTPVMQTFPIPRRASASRSIALPTPPQIAKVTPGSAGASSVQMNVAASSFGG